MQRSVRTRSWANAELSRATLMRIADLVHGEAGIVINDEKASLVQSRLLRRLRATGIGSFESYLRLVCSERGADERRNMLRALTTNVTRFYREPHHLENLRQHVLPAAATRLRSGGRLRIWSAACSTGEEPYSIAMEVCAHFSDAERLDVKILATDIDSDVLARAARTGTYSGRAVSTLPQDRLRFFPDGAATEHEGDFRIAENVRRLVSFRPLNLLKEWPFRGPFDAIFCRNVMIYFDRDTQASLIERFAGVSVPGTRLYIGHSERMVGPAQPRFRSCGTTSYVLER